MRRPSAEQVLRDARALVEEVARVLELVAKTAEIDVEHPPLPFAHFAGNDHGLDIAPFHERHHGAGYVVRFRNLKPNQKENGFIRGYTYDWAGRRLTESDPDTGSTTNTYDAGGNTRTV